MTIQKLKQLNTKVADQVTVLSALSAQWDRSLSPNEQMEVACHLENHANLLRIQAERLATGTRELYTEE